MTTRTPCTPQGLKGRRLSAALLLWCLVTLGFAQAQQALAQPTKADEILKKADEVRNPSDSFSMLVDVVSAGSDDARFEVLIKGKDKTLIRTKRPVRDVGRNILMIEENMWAYIPNLKRAVRVSLNQKLTGQAANGDISRMRWFGDYKAEILSQDAEGWTLDLSALRKGLTYDRIKVWVSKKGFQPQKAEYLTSAGKVLKTAAFGNYRSIAGAVRPTEITIRDANDTSKSSTIVIREMRTEDFPESLFHQNSLK
jgi:outer membrane lipoprotein-sorting protein